MQHFQIGSCFWKMVVCCYAVPCWRHSFSTLQYHLALSRDEVGCIITVRSSACWQRILCVLYQERFASIFQRQTAGFKAKAGKTILLWLYNIHNTYVVYLNIHWVQCVSLDCYFSHVRIPIEFLFTDFRQLLSNTVLAWRVALACLNSRLLEV